jgi:hypothetical protein
MAKAIAGQLRVRAAAKLKADSIPVMSCLGLQGLGTHWARAPL